MDIRQLRYFIAIAEEKQISAAAKKLHMAQPPLSQQLKQMEEELGVPLVIRHGRGLELTEAGSTLYRHALHITKSMEQTQMEVRQTGLGMRGKLTIGVNTLSAEAFSRHLLQFQSQYPDITYKIQQNESAHLCRLIRERAIELALIRFPLQLDEFAYYHIKTEPLYFLTSPLSALDGRQATYEQMGDFPLIIPSTDGLGLHHMIVERLSREHMEANIVCECSDIALLMELVEAGFGAAIVPEVVLQKHRGYKVKVHELADSAWTASSGFIWLKEHHLSPSASRFLELWKDG
ncbi:LysR family transcriptional regulator [Paenibacillus sp. H1-7]|nr:LysR family transcriptional regulator [Paenibacillus sp. H1-7]ULL19817.1 LysR family transcriptional regulator [Paenibacillus sp. H1-7]